MAAERGITSGQISTKLWRTTFYYSPYKEHKSLKRWARGGGGTSRFSPSTNDSLEKIMQT